MSPTPSTIALIISTTSALVFRVRVVRISASPRFRISSLFLSLLRVSVRPQTPTQSLSSLFSLLRPIYLVSDSSSNSTIPFRSPCFSIFAFPTTCLPPVASAFVPDHVSIAAQPLHHDPEVRPLSLTSSPLLRDLSAMLFVFYHYTRPRRRPRHPRRRPMCSPIVCALYHSFPLAPLRPGSPPRRPCVHSRLRHISRLRISAQPPDQSRTGTRLRISTMTYTRRYGAATDSDSQIFSFTTFPNTFTPPSLSSIAPIHSLAFPLLISYFVMFTISAPDPVFALSHIHGS